MFNFEFANLRNCLVDIQKKHFVTAAVVADIGYSFMRKRIPVLVYFHVFKSFRSVENIDPICSISNLYKEFRMLLFPFFPFPLLPFFPYYRFPIYRFPILPFPFLPFPLLPITTHILRIDGWTLLLYLQV